MPTGNITIDSYTNNLYADAYFDGTFYILNYNLDTGTLHPTTTSPLYLGLPRSQKSQLWYLSEEISSNDFGIAQIVKHDFATDESEMLTDFAVSIKDYMPSEAGLLAIDYIGIGRNVVIAGKELETRHLETSRGASVVLERFSGSNLLYWEVDADNLVWELRSYDLKSRSTQHVFEVRTTSPLYNACANEALTSAYFTNSSHEIVSFDKKSKEIISVRMNAGLIRDMKLHLGTLYYTYTTSDFNGYVMMALDVSSEEANMLFKSPR